MISHEEATLLAGLLAAFKIIRLLAPHYVEARPAAAPMIDQMLASMAAIEEYTWWALFRSRPWMAPE